MTFKLSSQYHGDMSLEVQGLCKTFRDKLTLKTKQVLFDVSFAVPEKSVTGFLGSNGAGKTTTIKCLLGLLRHEKGDINFFNREFQDHRDLIGYLPERPYFYEYLTGREFLVFYGQLSLKEPKSAIQDRADQLLDKVGLGLAKDRLLRTFSKGMLQRVGLAQALIHNPRFLILDEPMSGLDPDGRFQVSEIIRELGEKGTTIFFSSHLLDDVERLCDRLVIIDHGRIHFNGDKNDFLKGSEKGFEVIYKDSTSRIVTQIVSDVSQVTNLLNKIDSSGAQLVSVKEPHISLEQAFNKLKREVAQL